MVIFINRFLRVYESNITSLNFSGISQNENDVEGSKIINGTIEHWEICKNCYADIYANVVSSFQNYLKNAPGVLIEKMENDLRFNLYSSIDLKNELNSKEVTETFDRFSLRLVDSLQSTNWPLTGDVPSFVRSSDVISPSELYKRFSSSNARRLVGIHFLGALNVHLGGLKTISKNAVSEFFHNLSMQALSKSDDAIWESQEQELFSISLFL